MCIGLCQFKDILGKPYEGFHAARLGGLARNDLVGTVVITLALTYLAGGNPLITLPIVAGGTVAIHRFFCVPTALNVALGVGCKRS